MQNTTVTRGDIADWVPIIPSCEIIADPNPPARDETNRAKESDARLVRLAHQG